MKKKGKEDSGGESDGSYEAASTSHIKSQENLNTNLEKDTEKSLEQIKSN